MKQFFFFIFTLGILTCAAQKWDWAQSSTGGLGKGTQTAVNKKGEVFLIIEGSSMATVNYGTQSYPAEAVLAKHDSTGQIKWGYALNSAPAFAVSADSIGNVYVSGHAWGGAVIHSSGGTDTIQTNGGGFDAYLAKYNSTGKLLWIKTHGDTASDDCFTTLKTDQQGNSYASGYGWFYSSIGSSWHERARFFFNKYDTNGNLLWSRVTPWENYAVPYTADLDNNGNSYLAGVYYTSVAISSATLPAPSVSIPMNMFMLKYDSNGNLLWLKQEGTNYDSPAQVSVDNKGYLYMTGMVSYPSTFGSSTVLNGPLVSSGIFISKHDSLGNLVWAKTEGARYPKGIAYDSSGFFLTGVISPPVNNSSAPTTGTIGTGSNAIYLSSSKRGEFFVAKYTDNCVPQWVITPGASGCCGDASNQISSDKKGNCFVTGNFEGTTIMGFTTLNSYTNNINYDAFIVKVRDTSSIITTNTKNELSDQYGFIIFPNPSHNSITVNYSSSEENVRIQLSIKNVIGQSVFSKNMESARAFSETINVVPFAKGIYFVEIATNSRKSVKKLVVE